ncbi:MBL fold metallo-hydrolase [Sphingomonas sp.]|jgi:phosphoribosyl 1,2-cyclic phosphate phosphodiesterase|uniref:MBL fold metallo-hydrolase n=1 Tax=Sphingomonas sp. TaxID=28214 RepID=UPI002626E4C2|nr:MBL fold metallo-hydrolase [Sphingomonas sp.]MDF2493381.1 beta-lactamase [Sphingomonas sp.]
MKVRILGSGTSTGVPRIGNDWGECDPAEPRNNRTRVSLLVEAEGTRVLVDTGPDLRHQLLAANVGVVDAVIWTHEHADHVFGIDDLRQIYHQRGTPVPAYARPQTRDRLEGMFGYVFHGRGGYPPTVTINDLPDKISIGALTISVADQPHGRITSAGLRFEHGGKSVGYATDLSGMTNEMRALYSGLDMWIVDALRRKPHPSHPHLGKALRWIEEFAPRHAVLTHMDQSMDYATLRAELPPHVEPAYDGLEFIL